MSSRTRVICDGCRCSIVEGERYKCLKCSDYDLCYDCFANKNYGKYSNHSSRHSVQLLLADGEIGYRSYHTVYCDGCGSKSYTGCRYRCLQCRFFDLCEFCYVTNNFGPNDGNHHHSHRMQVILSPLDRQAIPHHNFNCTGCQTQNITGNRYKCELCKHFTLCERCYATNTFTCYDGACNGANHSDRHPMYKIPAPTSMSHSFRIWKAIAIKIQTELAKDLGKRDWDRIDTKTSQWDDLAKKIGFALYNAPTLVPTKSNSSEFGYKQEEEKRIKKLRQKVLDLSESHKDSHIVWINFVFVSFWSEDKESMMPLIRVLKYTKNNHDCSFFVEPTGRTYDGWADFLDANKLPECHICYPKDGWYKFDKNDDCALCFGQSAECDTSRQLAQVGDIAATIGGVVGTGIALVGLFTPLAPVATAVLATTTVTAGGYGAARSTYKLVDRSKHEESIDPFDNREAFFCWFGVIGAGFALSAAASTGLISTMAARGTHVNQFTRVVTNAAIFGNLGVNYVGIVAGITNLLYKIDQKEEVTPLEIFQLSASVLFFSNQVVNVQTASEIIKNIQQGRFDYVRNFMNEDQRRAFDTQIENNRQNAYNQGNCKTGKMHGGEKTVRQVNEAIANNDLSPLFEHYTRLPEFKSGEAKFNTIGRNGEFPIRYGSEKLGVDHIVNRHGAEFEQQGYANSREGVVGALRDCMKDGHFKGFGGQDYLVTYWETKNSDVVLTVVFTKRPSGYLTNSFGQYKHEIVTSYFTTIQNYQVHVNHSG